MAHRFYTRWIIGGIVVLLLVAGACVLWYRHDTAPARKAAADAEAYARQWEKDRQAQAKRSTETEQATEKAPAENTTSTAEKPINKITGAETDTSTDKTVNPVTAASQKMDNAEVRMSPNGLGPYPEVPDDYRTQLGLPPWEAADLLGTPPPSREGELIARVMIKLWKEGNTQVKSGVLKNGKVYVNYLNHAYIRRTDVKNADGTTTRAITAWSSAGDIRPTPEQMRNGYIPPGVRVTDLDEVEDPGIEPYSFLGLDN